MDDFENEKKVTLKHGLGRILFLWFLILAVVPLLVISFVYYQSAYNSLHVNAENALSAMADMRTAEIDNYFDEMFIDLHSQAESEANANFLARLQEGLLKSGESLDTYVQSRNWSMLVEESGSDLRSYLETYGHRYHDIFLIDPAGNILFSVSEEDDLGTNLFQGKYANTRFSEACRKALDTGLPSFSDYERYEASGNLIYGFIADNLTSRDGERIGLVVFQFTLDQIDAIMQKEIYLGKTAETYLVGSDLKMRSNSVLSIASTVMQNAMETEQIALIQREIDNKLYADEAENPSSVYEGPHGAIVFGMHREFDIRGNRFSLVAEIEEQEAFATVNRLRNVMIYFLVATVLLVIWLSTIVAKLLVRPLMILTDGAIQVETGNLENEIAVNSKNEIGLLASSFNKMLASLRAARIEQDNLDWLSAGKTELSDRLRGELGLHSTGNNIISVLCRHLSAQVGTIYFAGASGSFILMGDYATAQKGDHPKEIVPGKGLVGQAILEQRASFLTNVPVDYAIISSSVGHTAPLNIGIVPIMVEDKVIGIFELGTLYEFTDLHKRFLSQVNDNIAIAIITAQARARTNELLVTTTSQAEELQVQQEELRQTNEELEEQTMALKQSEEELQSQQEELRVANEDLEEHVKTLAAQKKTLSSSRKEVEKKARDLEMGSRYKSEFLANMSHELRTPLNSVLILSQLLSVNKEGNLSDKQMEFASTIHSSGSDLLVMINEILDLAKVESGKMEVQIGEFFLEDLVDDMKRDFDPFAQTGGVDFVTKIDSGLSESIYTDGQRVKQVVRNLLSNAFKFTERGEVCLRVTRPRTDVSFQRNDLVLSETVVIMVSDSGVGIPVDKQVTIFEAFQQVDGTTRRKYGGTGLGLSISRAFTELLGGELRLESSTGKGSIFAVYLPNKLKDTIRLVTEPKDNPDTVPSLPAQEKETEANTENTLMDIETYQQPLVPDDRNDVKAGDRVLLVIEDDSKFAVVLRDQAHEKGFKCLVAGTGEIGLHFADYYKPSGIVLDIRLPGIDGWTVMERLKVNPDTRHIPVHFMSGLDKSEQAMRMGAIGFFTKPVSIEKLDNAFDKLDKVSLQKVKKLLIVEDDDKHRKSLIELIGNGDVESVGVATAEKALELMQTQIFNCIILDLGLKGMSGFEMLERMRTNPATAGIPVIVYTGRELNNEEADKLERFTDRIIVKSVRSPERLLAETSLFLHRVNQNMPLDKQMMARMAHDKDEVLTGKRVLIVDDDMRNVFALTSVLEEKGLKIFVARNGIESLEQLNKNPAIDLVLMDIMMPEMDGYTATRKIREQSRFAKLPIIALTAKAMKGDKNKCINAGASDYLAKPVDTDKLLSLLRVWMYK